MKKFLPSLIFALTIVLPFLSCTSAPSTYTPSTSRDRQLSIGGYSVSESNLGGVERWYVVDNYNTSNTEVRFQVGYFIESETGIGFILYGNGTTGELADFSRQGLDLRWDWGDNLQYSFIIQPDGTGLYYDFSTSTDGKAKPRGIYKAHKF